MPSGKNLKQVLLRQGVYDFHIGLPDLAPELAPEQRLGRSQHPLIWAEFHGQ